MKMVDTNGDGEIDFQEFMQMMRTSLDQQKLGAKLVGKTKHGQFLKGQTTPIWHVLRS